MELLLLGGIAIIVFLISFLFSNLGLGGGLLYMPALVLVGLLPFAEARPISLAAAIATSAASTLNHHRKGKLSPRHGALASLGTVLGVLAGLFLIQGASDTLMEISFGAFLVIVAVQMYRDIDRKERGAALGAWMMPVALALAFGSGVVSIALAVGGGLLLVPLFLYVWRLEPRTAVGTSSMVAAVNTVAGLALLFVLPSPGTRFDLVPMGLLAGVAVAGAFLGSRWGLENLKTRSVYALVVVVTLAAAAMMLAKGLGVF